MTYFVTHLHMFRHVTEPPVLILLHKYTKEGLSYMPLQFTLVLLLCQFKIQNMTRQSKEKPSLVYWPSTWPRSRIWNKHESMRAYSGQRYPDSGSFQGETSGDHFKCESQVPLVLLAQSAGKFGLRLARIKEWTLYANPATRFGKAYENMIFH